MFEMLRLARVDCIALTLQLFAPALLATTITFAVSQR
jgi:hypothetical protein